MVFRYLLLIYPLLIALVGWRLNRLAAGCRLRSAMLVLYWAAAALFPVTQLLAHTRAQGLARFLREPGLHALPYLLYLFVVLVVADAGLWLAIAARRLPRAALARPRVRRYLLAIVLAAPAAIVAVGAARYDAFQVSQYRIEVPGRASPLSGVRVAVASDLHLGAMTRSSFMPRFAAAVNALDADVLLLPGDVVEGHGDDGEMVEFARQFRRIRTRYGMFAAPGNHEGHGGGRGDFFARAGIVLLADSACAVGGALELVGRKDWRDRGRQPLAQLLQSGGADLPVVVLDHRPLGFADVARQGVDVQVSGHTHAGQLFPLNLITEALYDLSWGHRQVGDTHFFVTSGTQGWGPRVRTAGACEIMLLDLVFTPVTAPRTPAAATPP